MKAETRFVTRIWHPTIRGGLHDLGNGVNARVFRGEPAYQVTSGEVVGLGSENFDYSGQAILTVDRQTSGEIVAL